MGIIVCTDKLFMFYAIINSEYVMTFSRNRSLRKMNKASVPDMRLTALLMVALVFSMSGSIAYASNSIQPDKSKMLSLIHI